MSNTTRYGISALGLQYKDQAQNDEILIDQETGQIHYKRPDGKIVTSSGGGVGGAVPDGVIGTNDILRTVTTESISNILKEGVEKNPSLAEPVRLSLNNLEGTKKEVISYKVTLTTPKSVNHISNGEVTYRFSDVEKLLLDDESLLVIEPIFDKGVKLTDLLKSGGNYYNYQLKFSFSNYSVNNMNNIEIASMSRSSMTRNNILIYSLDKRKLNDITFNKTDSELILNNVDLVKANSVSSKLTGLNINDLKIHGFLIYLINIDPYRSGRPINEFNNSPDTDNLKLLMRENAYEIFKNDIIEMKSKEIKHIENIQSSQDFINYLSSLGGRDVKNHLIYLYDGIGDLFSRMSTYLSRNNFYSVDMRFYTDGTGYQTSYSTKRNGRYNVYITYDGELKKVYFYLNSVDVSGVTAGEDSLKLNTDNDRPVEFKTNDGRIVTLQEVFQSASEGKRKIADILTGLGIPTDTEADWASIEKSMKQNVMSKSDNLLNKAYPKGYYKVIDTTDKRLGRTLNLTINNKRKDNLLMDMFLKLYRNISRYYLEDSYIALEPYVHIPIVMGERLFFYDAFYTNQDRSTNDDNDGTGRKFIHCIIELEISDNEAKIIWVKELSESDFGNKPSPYDSNNYLSNRHDIIYNIAKKDDLTSFYLISNKRICECILKPIGLEYRKIEIPSNIVASSYIDGIHMNLNQRIIFPNYNYNEKKINVKYLDLSNINMGFTNIFEKSIFDLLPKDFPQDMTSMEGVDFIVNDRKLFILYEIKKKINISSYDYKMFLVVQKISLDNFRYVDPEYSSINEVSSSSYYNYPSSRYYGVSDKYFVLLYYGSSHNNLIRPIIINLKTGKYENNPRLNKLMKRIKGLTYGNFSFRTDETGNLLIMGTSYDSGGIDGVDTSNGNHFPIVFYMPEDDELYIDRLRSIGSKYNGENATYRNKGLNTTINNYKGLYLTSWSYNHDPFKYRVFKESENISIQLPLGLDLTFKREIIVER